VDLIEERAEFCHIEPGGTITVDAEIAPGNLAAERQALQIEKAPCPLQVGWRVRIARGQALEFPP
jgi:hypothetical protein